MAGPVFILAPPRCFTTVVSAMLGQHPQMYGLPETYLFTCDTVGEWFANNAGTDRVHGLLRAVSQVVFGEQTFSSIELARDWLNKRTNRRTRDVFQALGERVFPLALVEKTPKVTEQIGFMASMTAEFPQARFIHLVRHPLAHACSRLERRLKQSHESSRTGDQDLFAVAELLGADPQMLWYRSNLNILAFLATMPVHRQRRVRGEDLLADPDENLRAICEWLELRCDSEAIHEMKHPERSPFASFGPRNARRGGDEKFFRAPALRPPQLTRQNLEIPLPWRRDNAKLTCKVRDLAQRLGYT